MDIKIAHSPDSDDAFMFFALAQGKLPTGEFRFTHRLEDIETLNRKALEGEYEVSAISIHAYAYVAGRYALLSSGASMGDRYGPLVVSRNPLDPGDLRGRKIAIPGMMTSAYLALRLLEPDFEPIVMPFDRIMEAAAHGQVDAGLLIHEGQLTYSREGMQKVIDLGEWWHGQTGLPLPLGGNGIRRDLGPDCIREISRLIRESIQYGLEHRAEALAYAMQFARGLHTGDADRFISMYVNRRTLDYGDDGRRAVRLFLDKAYAKGLIPHRITVEFTD